MSVESMAIVFNHSASTGAARALLLSIANHADTDGEAWPGLQRLAIHANINLRNARIALRLLEDLGEIKTDQNAGGTQRTPDHTRPNLYKVVLKCPPNCDGTSSHNLLCVECGERLPYDRRSAGLHKTCEAERKRLGAIDPGDENAPRSSATSPVVSDLTPRSPATPEQSINPSLDISPESHVGNRASAREDALTLDALDVPGIDFDPCPKFSSGHMPHAPGRDGKCVSCGKQAA
jgi:hypothetical protein